MSHELNKLFRRAQMTKDEREKYRSLDKFLNERYNDIRGTFPRVKTNFWCDECNADFTGMGHKEVRKPPGGLWFAFYRAFCPKGHTAIRRITDQHLDPYFWRSRWVKKDRAAHADEMLTPADPRFKLVYPEQWEKIKAGELKRVGIKQ